jgi:hypothetical protein
MTFLEANVANDQAIAALRFGLMNRLLKALLKVMLYS